MKPNRIREIREAHGLSGIQLAKLAETSVQQIYRLEMGDRKLTLQWMKRIADALKVNEYELLGESRPDVTTALVLGLLHNFDDIAPLESPRAITGPTEAFSFIAVEVPEGSLQTRYRKGDVLFARETLSSSIDDILDCECLVREAADRRYRLKVVLRRLEGSTLEVCNPGAYERSIGQFSWVSPILWVKKSVTRPANIS